MSFFWVFSTDFICCLFSQQTGVGVAWRIGVVLFLFWGAVRINAFCLNLYSVFDICGGGTDIIYLTVYAVIHVTWSVFNGSLIFIFLVLNGRVKIMSITCLLTLDHFNKTWRIFSIESRNVVTRLLWFWKQLMQQILSTCSHTCWVLILWLQFYNFTGCVF